MNLDQYQELAHRTAIYPQALAMEYLALGLVGEAGELANKAKKIIRGDANIEFLEEGIIDELGDILWYVAELANECGISLEVVAKRNLAKLNKRMDEQTIKGTGDYR